MGTLTTINGLYTDATAGGRQVGGRRPGPVPTGDGTGRFRHLGEVLLPEWQVFVRRRDGRSEHFTFSRRRQLTLVGVIVVLAAWAGTATMMLVRQPSELADKKSQMEAQMASYQAAEHRLNSAHQMVSQVAREVDAVHANLRVLAEANDRLVRERAPSPGSATTVPLAQVGATEPAYDDDSQPGAREARSVREQVRKLEASLDELHQTYARAVHATADLAGQRVGMVAMSLRQLGLDPDRLMAAQSRGKGQGGPFIPLPAQRGGSDGLGDMIGRMEQWGTVKAVLQRLPLADPLHVEWEVNSPFGARHDPINNRTGIHEGVDLGAPYGTPIYATGSGVVRMAGPYDRYGLTIDIDHGDGIVTRYAHLSRIKVQVGQKVTRTTVIGLLGDTGRTTGAHLHYEIRVADIPRDPLKFISAGGDASEAR